MKIDDCFRNLYDGPFAQSVRKQNIENNFRNKLLEYNRKSFNLTRKEIDSLILSVASGKNTYKDLKCIIPGLNAPTMCSYLSDEPKTGPNQFKTYNLNRCDSYFQFKEIPDDFYYLYKFKPTDAFILNIPGENRLYELQKEQQNVILSRQSISSANAAVLWAKISVAVSIGLFVLEKLLD
ncbi:hypothetical protein [Allisonella histaminiformans]|uniref:hypothetical protein n=1 Tax=Allisonella histaminiformans TaxID=209880 RepID=UPI00388E4BCE